MLNPNMKADELRLHMGELTDNEARIALMAIALANCAVLAALQSPEMVEVVREAILYDKKISKKKTSCRTQSKAALAAVAKRLGD